MSTLKIFVSSSWFDMQDERQALERVLHRLRSTHFSGMEYFGARADGPREVSLAEVDRCDAYLGIFGHRYGSGITEAEYHRARERKLPCLVYLKAGEPVAGTQPDADRVRLLALRQLLRQRHTVVEYDDPERLAAMAAADLHNLALERAPGRAHAALREGHDLSIQRFVAEYLEPSDTRAVFGGREAELGRLDRWLDDAAAPPFALLSGPAGRGKSALLVNWVQGLSAQPGLTAVFFPVSVRFATNLALSAYVWLVTRLAEVHGEVAAATLDTPVQAWRGLLAAYLARPLPSGRRCLVVIDGADEAGDWQLGPDLFPLVPPQGLRVLVSARHQVGDIDGRGWLGHLGWSASNQALAIELRPLSPQGIEHVMRSMSVPLEQLSRRSEIVQELFRLSAGDPLVVKLYVTDLFTRGDDVARLQLRDLGDIGPGLEGYFGRWWKDQHMLWGDRSPVLRPVVEAAMRVLSCALGPLLSGELQGLMAGAGLSGVPALHELLRPLRRFIIGDGRSQGYAYAHPRLADYFREWFGGPGPARQLDLAFVDWGRGCLRRVQDGELAATSLPPYVLQYLGPHMERAGVPAGDFGILAAPAWVRAWERLDRGSHAGFLVDLSRLQAIAAGAADMHARQGQMSDFPAMELRVLLYQSSIGTLAGDVSIDALVALVQRGLWTPSQAIAYASRPPAPDTRLHLLLVLAARLDAEQRPLALAAALNAWRAVLQTPSAQDPLPLLLDRLAAPPALPVPAADTARLFECAARVAVQLPAPTSGQVLEALEERTARLPAEAAVLALRGMAPFFGPEEARDAQAYADWLVRRLTTDAYDVPAEPQRARERLWLLEPLCHGVDVATRGAATLASLRCILVLALDAAEHGIAPPTQAAAHVLTCLRFVPEAADDVATRLGPWLDPEQLERLAEFARSTRPAVHVRTLVALVGHSHGIARERYESQFLAALADHGWPLEEAWALLKENAAVPGPATLLAAARTLAERMPAPQSWRALDALLCRPTDGGGAPWAELVLDLLRSPALDERWCRTALAVLVDSLQTAGGLDSFEAWRPEPDDGGHEDALRRLIACTAPSPAQRRAAVDGLLARLPDATAALVQTSARTRSPMRPPRLAPSPAAPDEQAVAALQVEWLDTLARARPPRAGAASDASELQLASMLDVRSVDGGPLHALNLAQALAERVDPAPVRRAVALFLQGPENLQRWSADDLLCVPARACSGALEPPEAATLEWIQRMVLALVQRSGDLVTASVAWHLQPLADRVRAAVLQALLQHAVRTHATDASSCDQLIADTARLSCPTDEGLFCALALAGVHHITDRRPVEALVRHLDDRRLTRWLGREDVYADSAGVYVVLELLRTRPGGPAQLWEVILSALQDAGPPQRCTRWYSTLIELAGPLYVRNLIEPVRRVKEPGDRLSLQVELLVRLPPQERRSLRDEVLQWATGAPANVVEVLARDLAADETASAEALTAAVACARAVPDPARRQHLVSLLAHRLDGSQLVDLALSLRRLDDGVAVCRALQLLLRHSQAPECRSRLQQALIEGVERLRHGDGHPAGRWAAVLESAPLVPAETCWSWLRAVFAGNVRLPPDELDGGVVAALARACSDAPSDVVMGLLAWSHSHAAYHRSADLVLALVPSLPWEGLLDAVARIDDDRVRARIGPLLDSTAQARLCRRGNPWRGPGRASWLAWWQERLETGNTVHATPVLCGMRPAAVAGWLRACTSVRQRQLAIEAWAVSPLADPDALAPVVDAAAALPDAISRGEAARALAAWLPDAAIAWPLVTAIAAPADRALALLRLSRVSGPDGLDACRREALSALASEPVHGPRAHAAAEWAAHDASCVPSALALIWSGRDDEAAAAAWCTLLPRLADAESALAVASLERLPDETLRTLLLVRVAGVLSGPQAGAAALAALGALPHAASRSRALCALMPHLDAGLQDAAATAVEGLRLVDFAWLEGLGALASRWPLRMTEALAQQAAVALPALIDAERRAQWLAAGVPAWPDATWAAWHAAARQVADAALQADLLIQLLDTRADTDRQLCCESAMALTSRPHRALVMWRIATLTDDASLHSDALADALCDECALTRIDVLASMAELDGALHNDVRLALEREQARHPQQVARARQRIAAVVAPAKSAGVAPHLAPEALAHTPAQVPAARRKRPDPLTGERLAVLTRDALHRLPPAAGSAALAAFCARSPSARTSGYSALRKAVPPVFEFARLQRYAAEFDRWRVLWRELEQLCYDDLVQLVVSQPALVSSSRQAELLVAALGRSARVDRAEVVRVALQLRHAGSRQRALAAAAYPLPPAAADCLRLAWRQWLQDGELLRRQELIERIDDALPLLRALGGEQALVDAGLALVDTQSLWP